MFKKYLKICLVILGLLIIYLFAAHWHIYHVIRLAGLKAADNQHEYILNVSATSSQGLVYAALGDSLTAGVGVDSYSQSYPYLVAEKLAGTTTKVTHLNFSYPGARSSDLIRDLLAKTIAAQPNVITILIGTNDVQGTVSVAEFQRNYTLILTKLKTETKAKINVVSIPFIGADSLFLPPFDLYYHARALSFNKVIQKLANDNKLNYIDLTNPTARLGLQANSYYATDKFHPSNNGYQLWAQIIYDHLNK